MLYWRQDSHPQCEVSKGATQQTSDGCAQNVQIYFNKFENEWTTTLHKCKITITYWVITPTNYDRRIHRCIRTLEERMMVWCPRKEEENKWRRECCCYGKLVKCVRKQSKFHHTYMQFKQLSSDFCVVCVWRTSGKKQRERQGTLHYITINRHSTTYKPVSQLHFIFFFDKKPWIIIRNNAFGSGFICSFGYIQFCWCFRTFISFWGFGNFFFFYASKYRWSCQCRWN